MMADTKWTMHFEDERDMRLAVHAPELVRELRSSTNELKMALSLVEDAITQDTISFQIRDNEAAIAKAGGNAP